MDQDLRAELEAAAAQRQKRNPRWNLTEEVVRRLEWSLRREREDQRQSSMRAWNYLISHLAETLTANYTMPRDGEWHRDPFMFRAFKRGVTKLLDALEPAGEAKSPFNIKGLRESEEKLHHTMADWYETPETAGDYAVDLTLRGLFQRGPGPEKWEPVLRKLDELGDPEWPNFGANLATDMWRKFRTMAKTRETLGIKAPKEPKS
jgi:hypothetical protein